MPVYGNNTAREKQKSRWLQREQERDIKERKDKIRKMQDKLHKKKKKKEEETKQIRRKRMEG